MNNNLGFWRQLMFDLMDVQPKTEADLAYVYKDLVRPEIPTSALWDAEKGARLRHNTNDSYKKSMSIDDFRKEAIKNRGWGLDQTAEDIPVWTPTHRYMEQLLNPNMLIVPKKEDMGNFWK